ncbi:glycosyltransferase family 4 protein [Patescibacteria group bacterium]|nr:glycosyltransferase family 4 protein [Patescibacteria group bacterium]
MKIIYITNARIPTEKAHGFQISKTCEKFSDFGNEIELWIPYRKNDITDNLFDYYGIRKNFKVKKISCLDIIFLSRYVGPFAFYAQSLLFSMKLFFEKAEKDSIIYSRDILTVLVFRLRGFDVVYNAHNWSKKMKWFMKIFLNKDLKIVCNSEGTRKQIAKDGFTNSIAVPNGVDLEDFDNLEDKFEIRKNLELPVDKKIIMYVGHLYEWKGVDVVLDSAKLFCGKKDVIFVIIGGDEEERKKYVTKIINESVKNMLFLGHKFKKDIPMYLKSADILLLPNIAVTKESVNYTSPIKMFEYMASGVPIIASNLPSIREILNKKNSFLVEPNNPKALVGGIEKLLSDNIFAENIAGNAKKDVKKYTWDEYAKKILNFITI